MLKEKNKKLVFSIFYNDELHHFIGQNNIKTFLKGDYCIIKKCGDNINPIFTYHEKNDKNEKILGDFVTITDYIANTDRKKAIIMIGFSRALAGNICKFAKIKKNCYKLIGAISISSTIPDFLIPIFEKNEKYYFQNSENGIKIDSFDEIIDENYLKNIKLFKEYYSKFLNIQNKYTINSDVVCVFQLELDKIIVSNLEEIEKFLIDNNFEIRNFEQEMSNKKGNTRILKRK